MGLDDYTKTLIYDYAMQTLSSDLLTNALYRGGSVGASLRDMVLAKQPVRPLTNPFEEAITGTLRADAAATRQNARNVGEAADMVGVAKNGVAQIADALQDMEDIIDAINSGELSASSAVVQADYNALRDKIEGLVAGTDYNGIYMLDGGQWDTDQIDANGNVWIQGYKDGGFNVTFHNLDGYNWSNLDGTDLGADGTRATQLGYVQDFQADVNAILDVYTNKQNTLEAQQLQISSQADLLDQTVNNRKPESGLTTEQILMNLLLGDSGSIIDDNG